jgi:NAD(P)-dependent dehydrogenase (short-subunit alcohol dehydrogenase family)
MSSTQPRRWLITSISSGIGTALARAVLGRGDSIVGICRDQATLTAFGAETNAIAFSADMRDPAQVREAAKAAIAGGPIDILVNNAGQSLFGAFEETSIEEARALIDVNLFGPWALTQALLPHFRERGAGVIVQISSGCGLNGTPGLSAYCASKFALEGMTEALGQEVAGFGIRTMLVEPGAIATRFISHGTREAQLRLPAYDFVSGQGKAMLDGYYATAASPPEHVATAILAALDSDAPPTRLLVGDDVRAPVRQKAAALAALAD